jgi:hypothetical protein
MRASIWSRRGSLARAGTVVVSTLMLAAACATPEGDGGTPAAAGSSPAVVTETPGGSMTDLPGATLTLRGTVGEGVEQGCVVLTADDGRSYVLLGGDPAVLRSGGRVEVRGAIRSDLMSYCQQGPLVAVESVRRI